MAQRHAVLREGEARGGGDIEFVKDVGFSGGTLERPGIAGLLPKLGLGDKFVVTGLDRLSRSFWRL